MPIDPSPIARLSAHFKSQTIQTGLTWAKVVSLFGDTIIESRVDRDGRFSFKGMPTGKYILMIFDDDILKHHSFVDITFFNDPLDILDISEDR